MARTFSQEVADHYNVAVDLAVHDPRPSGDPRNFHAHLLLTTREVTPLGLGAKTGLDMGTTDRVRLGMPDPSHEFTAIRERWATITNEALREANLDVRVDHRSLSAQGIDREPRPYLPFAAFKIEQSGKYSEVAEEIRARYTERAAARQARVVEQGQPAISRESTVATGPAAPKSLADIRREARENWLKKRGAQVSREPQAEQQKSPSSDDDYVP
jgi:hypothetical protein